MLRNWLGLIAAAGLVAGCAGSGATSEDTMSAKSAAVPTGDGVLATLWLKSAEYQANARVVWSAAKPALDAALANKSWTAATEQTGKYEDLPPAVIVDVDETVLDNTPFQARMILAGTGYNRPAWDAWVEEAAAKPVPGALEFARYAAERGVTIFYVTNRDAPGENATRRNLQEAGFPLYRSIDYLLMRGERPEWTSDKTTRRAHIAERYRIVMLAGDDFNDFIPGTSVDIPARAALAESHADWWGSRWFLLPNPTYGSWERASYGFDRDLSDDEKAARRMKALGER
ncbi:MAG: HAD family acid phosphatase [Pseudomonadota bacterium]